MAKSSARRGFPPRPQGPVWGHCLRIDKLVTFAACPLRFDRARNSASQRSVATCHVWTALSWQGKSSRRVAGRCSHVFGLLVRHTGPLAIMPSADQVPVKSPHSTMHWHMWVVLIAGSTGSALHAVRPPNLHITPGSRRDLVHAASATGSL